MSKLKVILLLSVLISILYSCITIYNYDLSVSGLESLSATQNAVMSKIPASVDATKGTVANDIEIIKQQLDADANNIADSLRKDLSPILNDTTVELIFQINALDPENEIYTTEYSYNYQLNP